MTLTTTHRNGTGQEAETLTVEHRFEEVIAALPAPVRRAGPVPAPDVSEGPGRNGKGPHRPGPLVLALFCYENPETPVGQYAIRLARALAKRQTSVHLFTRRPFEPGTAGVYVHAVGEPAADGLLGQVEEFTQRACVAFVEQFPDPSQPVGLLGCEWSTVPALELLRIERKADFLLSLSSLERQRSDMRSELSQQIEEIEFLGLGRARAVLVQQPAVAEIARYWIPDCAARLTSARQPFPIDLFEGRLDPGVVKARYQIGPVDPTVLYIGDMDERHGPDVLMKAVPAILKDYKQCRFVFVGDGTLWWPLRVHARYLLLEHAVRLVGHVEGPALYELIQAADIIVVPSREQTEWWPVQAAWAARRPVVASHAVGDVLITHEQDGLLVYPHESSLVWGIERLLFDEDLLRRIAARGHDTLEERFGWNGVAAQVEELLGVPQLVS
ncbi:MAG TPA: glycosyltransferase family 4 protein [Gemmataceae bacterium]|nr:glycosyltransferase family 4 protein [Gemmataceae bacterium]